jgi:CheY-like chemotaxis protein
VAGGVVGGTVRAAERAVAAAPLVLVVEDAPAIRAVVTAALQADGYAVAQATDGLNGLDLLREVHPAAVVLDLEMPEVDGWQFLACYQHLTGGPLPIVVTSASMSPALGARLRGLGVQVCLAKPFDVDELLSSVGRALAASPVARPSRPQAEPHAAHLRELTLMLTRRLDASHALLIRAEETLGWSQARIRAYYAEHGLPLPEAEGSPGDD